MPTGARPLAMRLRQPLDHLPDSAPQSSAPREHFWTAFGQRCACRTPPLVSWSNDGAVGNGLVEVQSGGIANISFLTNGSGRLVLDGSASLDPGGKAS